MARVQPDNRRNMRRFPGGAARTDRKPRFDLIPFEFLEAVANVLTSGAVKHGPYNWKRGQKDFFLDAWSHAFVHLQKSRKATGAKTTWVTWPRTWRSWSGRLSTGSYRRTILPHVRRSAISTEMMPSPSTSARSLPH